MPLRLYTEAEIAEIQKQKQLKAKLPSAPLAEKFKKGIDWYNESVAYPVIKGLTGLNLSSKTPMEQIQSIPDPKVRDEILRDLSARGQVSKANPSAQTIAQLVGSLYGWGKAAGAARLGGKLLAKAIPVLSKTPQAIKSAATWGVAGGALEGARQEVGHATGDIRKRTFHPAIAAAIGAAIPLIPVPFKIAQKVIKISPSTVTAKMKQKYMKAVSRKLAERKLAEQQSIKYTKPPLKQLPLNPKTVEAIKKAQEYFAKSTGFEFVTPSIEGASRATTPSISSTGQQARKTLRRLENQASRRKALVVPPSIRKAISPYTAPGEIRLPSGGTLIRKNNPLDRLTDDELLKLTLEL